MNTGMIFTRQVLIKSTKCKLIHNTIFTIVRYVYVCYAADLAAGGERLLNIVTVVVIAAFSLQFFIIETVVGEGCTQSDRNTIILKHINC